VSKLIPAMAQVGISIGKACVNVCATSLMVGLCANNKTVLKLLSIAFITDR